MKYVALLRGINVGGKTRVEMPRLKAAFEALGCTDVSTYINSGNVLFTDARPASKLKPLIEKAIKAEFNFDVPVVLRDRANFANLVEKIPAEWTNDKIQKTDVMFLWDEIDNEDIIKEVVVNPKIETALYLPGALAWNISRDKVAGGAVIALIKSDLYTHMTIRNINTVRKLAKLLGQ